MIGVRLEPVDTWFFRDGTPFAADSAPQDGVASLFPPHPASVAGALRAALARCNGWNGAGRWPTELDAVLGDGPDDIGALSVDGPFLLRDGQPLFRAPRHLLGSTDAGAWTPRVLSSSGPGNRVRPRRRGAASRSAPHRRRRSRRLKRAAIGG